MAVALAGALDVIERAASPGPALDGGVVRHRKGTGIGLVRVVEELDRDLGLGRRHHDEGHVVIPGEMPVGADVGDHLVGIRMDRTPADVLVPGAGAREDLDHRHQLVGLRGIEEDGVGEAWQLGRLLRPEAREGKGEGDGGDGQVDPVHGLPPVRMRASAISILPLMT